MDYVMIPRCYRVDSLLNEFCILRFYETLNGNRQIAENLYASTCVRIATDRKNTKRLDYQMM